MGVIPHIHRVHLYLRGGESVPGLHQGVEILGAVLEFCLPHLCSNKTIHGH